MNEGLGIGVTDHSDGSDKDGMMGVQLPEVVD